MISQSNSLRIPLEDQSVHCCITSPPYFGLRSYNLAPTYWPAVSYSPLAGLPEIEIPEMVCCLGLEPTIEAYVGHLVSVFREVWRVLRDDSVAWLNLGDSYSANRGYQVPDSKHKDVGNSKGMKSADFNLPPKNLIGIPWRVALALQADGWILRSDVIWHKTNPLPESVVDRCTKSHEYVFMLAKQQRYFYDNEAVKEAVAEATINRDKYGYNGAFKGQFVGSPVDKRWQNGRPIKQEESNFGVNRRNKRTVWTVATHSFSGAHFATWPPKLVEPMIKAGTSQRGCCPECGAPWERVVEKETYTEVRDEPTGKASAQNKQDAARRLWERTKALRANGHDHNNPFGQAKTTGWRPTCDHETEPVPAIVLDPFCGSGTTGEVCRYLQRDFIGLDLQPEYLAKHALPRAENKTSEAALNELPIFAAIKQSDLP